MTPIIEKIRKLLALSKSSNANEAATAAALAQRLMAQYRLEPQDVLDAPELTLLDPIPLTVWKSVRMPPTWASALAARVARLNGCAIIIGRVAHDVWAFNISGQKTDVEAARFLFAWLMSEVQRLTEKNYHAHMPETTFVALRKTQGKGWVRTLKTSYRLGCIDGALNAMDREDAAVKQEAASRGLVVHDGRRDAALALLKQLHPDGREDGRQQKVNTHALEAGRAAGSHLHGHKPLGAGGARMLGDGK